MRRNKQNAEWYFNFLSIYHKKWYTVISNTKIQIKKKQIIQSKALFSLRYVDSQPSATAKLNFFIFLLENFMIILLYNRF